MIKLLRCAAVAASAIALVVTSASAASAHEYPSSSTNFNSAHTIGQTQSVSRGNLVGWWQHILWAEGAGQVVCGSGGFDGFFGSTTTANTKIFQTRYLGSASADGVVGPRSWGVVSSRLTNYGYNYGGTAGDIYGFTGRARTVYAIASTADSPALNYRGRWIFKSESNPNNGYHTMGHPDITFYKC